MSLSIVTSSTAGSSLDAPAGLHTTSAKGAEKGSTFDALLDEQTHADEPSGATARDAVVPRDTRPAKTARTGSGFSAAAFRASRTGARPPADSDAEQKASIADDDHTEKVIDEAFLATTVPPADNVSAPSDRADGDFSGQADADAARPPLPTADVQLLHSLTSAKAASMALAATDSTDTRAPEQATDLPVDLLPQDAVESFDAQAFGTSAPDARRGNLPAGARVLAEAALRARLAEQLASPDRLVFSPSLERARASQDAAATSTAAAAAAPATPSLPVVLQASSAAETFASRQTEAAPAEATTVDAFRLSKDAGGSADAEAGPDQHAAMASSERSALLNARAIHVVQSVANFETTLGNVAATPGAYAVATIPNESNVVSSIVQTMSLQMRDGVGTALVNLEPSYLGAVTIAIRVENGSVTATLHAENPQVRAWMEANEPALRQGLAEQGLSLDRLIVSDQRLPDERERFGRRQQSPEQPPARRRPRRDEASTFEVVV